MRVEGFATDRSPLRWLAIALVTMGMALAAYGGQVASGGVPAAQAFSSGDFCGSPGFPVAILAGQRCVDYRRLRHRYLQATIQWGDGPGDFCVGAKQNSDGTGGNTKYFGCHIPTQYPGKIAISPAEPAPGSPLGYATIINSTGHNDFFTGYMQWYP